MIYIGIDPVIVKLGIISLEWHGLLAALGILAGVVVAGRKMHQRGFDIAVIYGVAWWAVIGGILGARLFHVIDYADYYMTHPLQIIIITQGGLAIYGALFGGFVGAIIYVLKSHLPMGRFFDAGAPATILGLAVGRLGCLINGDAWGASTGGNWGIVYTNPADRLPANLLNVPTHPFPIYELVLDLGVFFLFSWLRDTGKVKANGAITLLSLLGYAVVRFFLTYFRQERIIFMGMQQAQLIALICVVTMVPALIYILLRNRQRGEEATPISTATVIDQPAGTE